MADPPTSTLPYRPHSDASAPSLTTLPSEILEQILKPFLPDKPIISMSPSHWAQYEDERMERCYYPEDRFRNEAEEDPPDDDTAREGTSSRSSGESGKGRSFYGDSSESESGSQGSEESEEPSPEESNILLEKMFREADIANDEGADLSIWKFRAKFRYDEEPVETAILRVNRRLYVEGSRLLYGRTLEVNIWVRPWNSHYRVRSSYFPQRDFPWAKMRKILISVHSVRYWEDVHRTRDHLLMICGFLGDRPSDSTIRKLKVVYRGPKQNIVSNSTKRPPSPSDLAKRISQAEALSIVLEPLRLIKQVQECEIQLPKLLQHDVELEGKVQRYLRGIKGEEPFAKAELLEDWEKFVFFREGFRRSEQAARWRHMVHVVRTSTRFRTHLAKGRDGWVSEASQLWKDRRLAYRALTTPSRAVPLEHNVLPRE